MERKAILNLVQESDRESKQDRKNQILRLRKHKPTISSILGDWDFPILKKQSKAKLPKIKLKQPTELSHMRSQSGNKTPLEMSGIICDCSSDLTNTGRDNLK